MRFASNFRDPMMFSPATRLRLYSRAASFSLAVLLPFAFLARPAHASASTQTAEQLLLRGNAQQAVNDLHSLTAVNPADGPAHLLLCRAFYAEQIVSDAVSECTLAVKLLPQSSAAEDWLGRAVGLKANEYGSLGGLVYASQVRDAFAAAVRLNPHDNAAVNDLGEFDAKAPSMIGGGFDKAMALADQVASTLPQTAFRIRGLAAEQRGDYGTAEREFRSAVGVSGAPGAWVDLGGYYCRRHNTDACVDALRHAAAADHDNGPELVDAAEILIAHKLQPQLAEQWLRDYLAGNARSDAAPAFRAETDLAKLLAAGGDKAAARTELNQALALAPQYAPAQRALRAL